MQINERGDLDRFPMLDAIAGEAFEERVRRSRQASEVAALEAVMSAREDELINGDAIAKAEKQRYWEQYERDQSRMNHRRIPTGITGVGYHKRATVARSATAGKW